MVIDKEIGRKTSKKETTIPLGHSTPHPMTFQIDCHNTTRWRKRNERLEFLNDKYNLDYYSDSDSDSDSEHETLV